MRCLVLVLTVAASLSADVAVSIETTSGDTIRGKLALATLPMTTGFGDIEIALEGIESITFGTPDVVRSKDGSVVQGTIRIEGVPLDSGLGRVMLKRENLKTLTVLGGEAVPAQGESYPIKIRRAYKTGDKWTVSGTVRRAHKRTRTLSGGTPHVEETHVDFEFAGQVLVVEVDAVGRVTRAECIVENCVGEGGNEGLLLPHGMFLSVSLLKGEPRIADKDDIVVNNDCIAEFLPVESSTPHSDDEVFGSSTSRKAGESWAIAGDLLADQLHDPFPGMKCDPKDVSGTVRLKGVGDVNGAKCMTMVLECRVANLADAQESKYDKARSGELTSTEEIALPIDETLPIASDTMTMHIVTKTSDREDSMDFSRSIKRSKVK